MFSIKTRASPNLDLSVQQQIFLDTLHFSFWLLGLENFTTDFCCMVLLWIVLHFCKNSELNWILVRSYECPKFDVSEFCYFTLLSDNLHFVLIT